MSIPYRREIDGLRAIAVGAVVFYHAFDAGTAGYVGVDIFFVISGYLITRLLLQEQYSAGRIDIAAFYARRARRIVPAATVLVLAILALSPLLLTPDAVVHTAKSAVAAALFCSNLFFQFASGGYFDGASEEMPLLHFWSLGVEEQFYLLWPALLVLLFRARLRLVPALGVLACCSFALAELLLRNHPDAAFYQAPARAWELAVGGIIAGLPSRAVPAWLLRSGMLLVLVACIRPFPHFPAAGALPAVAGAAVIVWAIHNGASDRILASPFMVRVGLVSYSLYLWHWPLLAFYRANTVGGAGVIWPVAICVFAIVLAFASHRWIEQPFRAMRWPALRTVLAGAAMSATLALSACAIGFVGAHANGAPNDVLARAAEHDTSQLECPYDATAAGLPDAACLARLRPVTAVWGDSFAYSWLPLGHALGEPSVTYSYTGCPPLLGFVVDELPRKRALCVEHNQHVLADVRRMDTVVLALSWQRYLPRDSEDRRATLLRMQEALEATLRGLSRVRRVVIVGPTPYLQDRISKCIRAGRDCGPTRLAFELDARPFRPLLAQVARDHPNVVIADPTPDLCTLAHCPDVRDGVPLYYDRTHLSRSAVENYSRRWAPTLVRETATR